MQEMIEYAMKQKLPKRPMHVLISAIYSQHCIGVNSFVLFRSMLCCSVLCLWFYVCCVVKLAVLCHALWFCKQCPVLFCMVYCIVVCCAVLFSSRFAVLCCTVLCCASCAILYILFHYMGKGILIVR